MKKKILKLAIPAALESLLDTVQLLVDTLMIGRISPYAVAAVGLSGQAVVLLYSFISVFYIGTNAVASRLFGAGKKEDAFKVITAVAILSLIVSTPFFMLFYFLNPYYFEFMGVSAQISLLGEKYLSILSYSIPFLFIGAVLQAGIHASGNTKTPLLIGITGNITNTFLNYCLIFGNMGFPRLEVEGAAIATTVSYILEVVIYILIYSKLKIKPQLLLDPVKKVLKIGVPAGIEKLLSFSSFLIFVKIIAGFGAFTLAGYQIGLRVEALSFMVGFGFATAAMILTGQHLGRKEPKIAEKSAKEILKLSSLFMGVMGALLVIFSDNLIKLFTDDPETIKEGSLYLKIVGISQIPLAFDFVLNGVLKGAGATRLSLFINIFSFWIFRIIPAYVAANITGNVLHVYLIMVFETFMKGIIIWTVFKIGMWKNINI